MPSAIGRSPVPTGSTLSAVVGRFLLCLIFVLSVAVPAASRAMPAAAQANGVTFSTAEATPADSLTYIVTTLDDRSAQWRLADTLLDRAGFGEALDEAMAEEFRDEAGKELPLDAFLGGEVAIVLHESVVDTLAQESMGTADLDSMLEGMGMATPAAEGAGPEAQGFAVILDARAPDTAWTGVREAANEDGAEESTYEGTTILYAAPDEADEEGMAAARVGDLILIGASPLDLHPVIDTADGRSPNITTVPEFMTARDALPSEFLMFSFINNLTDLELDMGPFGAASEGLLVDAFSASTVAADEAGFRIEAVTLPAEGETLPGTAENFQSDLVGLAPDNSLVFVSATNLGETGVLDALGAVLIGLAFGMGDPSMMTPDASGPDVSPEEVIAQQYEDAAGLLGVNLQTDLFRQFAGEYGGWLAADMAGEDISGLFVSGVEDADTVSNALMQLSFLIQGATGAESPLTTREIGGDQVYVIELGDGAGSTFEFGVVDDQFVIGNGAAVDRLAGEPGEALANNEQFLAVMDTLPVETHGTIYIDLGRALPMMEAASEEADDFGFGEFDEITDASETCATYASQEEAQAAYDAAEPDTFDLDQDFDGEVCEDFFDADDPAEDQDDDASDELEEAFANVDYSAIKAFASVTYEEDGLARSSSILYISE